MRYSKQREAVYQVVCATRCHPDAYYVYGEVRKIIPNISLGTVYRNLNELCLEGRICKLSVGGGVERYDGSVQPHAHLVCTECGRVIDLDAKQIQVAHNIPDIHRCEITFYGVCQHCKGMAN